MYSDWLTVNIFTLTLYKSIFRYKHRLHYLHQNIYFCMCIPWWWYIYPQDRAKWMFWCAW